MAVGIRLGLNLCEPHSCQCGAIVDARGLHSFVCKSAPGRTARHHALNDVIYRAFSSAGIPATKEPVSLTRQDGKRSDGLTLVPWCARQTPNIGCNGCQHLGGLLCGFGGAEGWGSSGAGSNKENQQIFSVVAILSFPTYCC